MRIAVLGLGAAAALACAGPARAQYGRSGDPCSAAAMPSSSPVIALIGLLGQHGRDEACAAERRAQWDEYNARQKAAKETADAAAAHAAEQQAETVRQKDAAAQEQDAAQARPQRQHAAAQTRIRHARVDHDALAEREAAETRREASARQRQTAIMLARAETAPDNHCREPALARQVLTAWNGLDAMRTAGIKAVDIEHLTTVSFDAQARAVACHGVFVTNQGFRMVGTATVKTNVAGDPMFVWERDERQNLADYATPAPSADSPELARAVHVEQATGTGAAPVFRTPATLSLTPVSQR